MASYKRILALLSLLFAILFKSAAAVVVQNTCSASDIAAVGSQIANLTLRFTRVLNPLPVLTKDRVYSACQCIVAENTPAPKANVSPAPTGVGYGPKKNCYASDIKALDAVFKDPTAFCNFYSAWSLTNDPNTPISALTGPRTYNACQCFLAKSPLTSTTTETTTTTTTTTKNTITTTQPSGVWSSPVVIGNITFAGESVIISSSQRFGHNITDVYGVDSNGDLVATSSINGGSWTSTTIASGLGPNCYVAASSQPLVATRTNVFHVDADGILYLTYYDGTGWTGPTALTAKKAFAWQIELVTSESRGAIYVFGTDSNGYLQVATLLGTGPWANIVPVILSDSYSCDFVAFDPSSDAQGPPYMFAQDTAYGTVYSYWLDDASGKWLNATLTKQYQTSSPV